MAITMDNRGKGEYKKRSCTSTLQFAFRDNVWRNFLNGIEKAREFF